MPNMKDVAGGCHCGAVRFEASVDMGQAMTCNCSHCEKKGFVLTFTPAAAFRITAGAERLTEYRFNRHAIAHQFCAVCGVQAFGMGAAPDGSAMAAVNLRCVDGVDLGSLTPAAVDGRSF